MKRALMLVALALIAVPAMASVEGTTQKSFYPAAFNAMAVRYVAMNPVNADGTTADAALAFDDSGTPACVPGFYCDTYIAVRFGTYKGKPNTIFDAATGKEIGCPRGFECKPKRSFFGKLLHLFR